MLQQWNDKIFTVSQAGFESLALDIFRYQSRYNDIYRRYIAALGKDPAAVSALTDIPFLPIRFFKSHQVTSSSFEPELVFESSGTTGSINSRHLVKEAAVYERSFSEAFSLFYGPATDWCIIGLLPSYLERSHSSLVYMVDRLVKQSGHPGSGFYLYEHEKLAHLLQQLEAKHQPTLLIGVTFALLDFAEKHSLSLRHTVVMETGGMKGRREELVRPQVHSILTKAFGVTVIHAEYGMTELLSQAYSDGNGLFSCPPWMKIVLRDEEDPLTVRADTGAIVSGAINVIDLANIHSCSFIATDDAGRLHPDGRFEVMGRLDNSDLRGCSLMVL